MNIKETKSFKNDSPSKLIPIKPIAILPPGQWLRQPVCHGNRPKCWAQRAARGVFRGRERGAAREQGRHAGDDQCPARHR